MTMQLRLSSLLMCSLLWSCGGGGNEAPPTPPSQSLPAGPLKLAVGDVGTKRIRLEWQSAQGASHYIVSRRSTAGGTFEPLTGKLVATVFTLNVALHTLDWSGLAFRVEACNEAGCIQDELQGLGPSLATAIGRAVAANPGAGDLFGGAVATSQDGSIVAVGATGEAGDGRGDAPNNGAAGAGAVYVFTREDGQLRQSAYVKAPEAGPEEAFGQSVALSADGRTLVVGAPGTPDDNETTVTFAGAAYVFRLIDGHWTSDVRLKPSTVRAQGRFGDKVAISANGGRIVVGAGSLAAATKGGVAIYDLVDADTAERTWHRGLELGAAKDSDGFGMSGLALSADGQTLAVGAEFDGKAGAAYVYQLLGDSLHALVAVPQAVLAPPASLPDDTDPATADRFGAALSLSGTGDVLAVGAPWDWRSFDGGLYPEIPAGNATGSGFLRWIGAVHIYQRDTTGTWARQSYIKPAGFLINGDGTLGVNGEFGRAVSLSADGRLLAVGHPGDSGSNGGVLPTPGPDSLNTRNSGAVQMYERQGTNWEMQRVVKAPAPNFGALGSAVALSLDKSALLVGAPGESTNAAPPAGYAGSLYLY